MPKISINSTEYNYRIKSSKKARYIKIQISQANGIELIIPKGKSVDKAVEFLKTKEQWILKHINVLATERNDYRFLGNEINIEYQYDLFAKKIKAEFINNKLYLVFPSGSEVSEKEVFNIWLKNEALKYIPERARFLGNKFGLIFNKITIRGQKSRWGSCSRNKNLSFNYKLMSYKKDVIDYVIIHELCHLREMNHSKKFWSLVETFLPDYKEFKKTLRIE